MKTSAVYPQVAAVGIGGGAGSLPSPAVVAANSMQSSSAASTPGRISLAQISRMTSNNRNQDQSARSKMEIVEGSLQLTDIIEGDSEVMCIRYDPDASLVAVGFADGSIKLYSSETAHCLYSLTTDEISATRLPVTSIRFCPIAIEDKQVEHRHLLAASYASGEVRFWHYTSGACLYRLVEPRTQTLSVAYNPPGDKFVTVGADPQVFLYDAETKQRISVMDATDSRDKMDGHRARVFSAVYHQYEPNILLTGGWDDTVQFWDDRQRHSIRKFFGPHICGDALDIDPVHNHILTGSWRKDNPLQIWDYKTAEKIKDVPQDVQYQSQLYCAQWVGRDSIVSGGCFSNMARVIDRGTLNTSGQLVQLPQGVYCLDNDRQGPKPRLAVGAACKIYLLRTAAPPSQTAAK